jgi:hypothetical protein
MVVCPPVDAAGVALSPCGGVDWAFVVLELATMYQFNIRHCVCRNVPLVHFWTSIPLNPGHL